MPETPDPFDMHSFEPCDMVISLVTRQDLLDCGDLIDITHHARGMGFLLHAAVSRALHAECLTRATPFLQDLAIRELLRELQATLRGQTEQQVFDQMIHPFLFQGVSVYAHFGGGDDLEPVLTLLLQGED